jgi:hypothetical protein
MDAPAGSVEDAEIVELVARVREYVERQSGSVSTGGALQNGAGAIGDAFTAQTDFNQHLLGVLVAVGHAVRQLECRVAAVEDRLAAGAGPDPDLRVLGLLRVSLSAALAILEEQLAGPPHDGEGGCGSP